MGLQTSIDLFRSCTRRTMTFRILFTSSLASLVDFYIIACATPYSHLRKCLAIRETLGSFYNVTNKARRTRKRMRRASHTR